MSTTEEASSAVESVEAGAVPSGPGGGGVPESQFEIPLVLPGCIKDRP